MEKSQQHKKCVPSCSVCCKMFIITIWYGKLCALVRKTHWKQTEIANVESCVKPTTVCKKVK